MGSYAASSDQLAKAVRQELLDSDLAKVVPASYSRINAAALTSSSGKIGESGRGAILVQIESMIDIGYSASYQLEIAHARRDARCANMDPNQVPAESNTATEADHVADFQAQQDDKIQATTVYPRRMLKLELADGGNGTSVCAIEWQRIIGLDMNTTKIGTKLLLKGVAVKDGCLLLTPQTVVVEGGCVREKDQVAEDRFIDKLRSQLGKPPQSDTPADGERVAITPTHGAAPRSEKVEDFRRGSSPDEDECELLAALEAEEEIMTAASSSKRPTVSTNTASSSTNKDTGNAQSIIISDSALPPPTGRRPATLIVPEGMTQSSGGKVRSQRAADAPPKTHATQEDPISLIDSDDDDLFASIPDSILGGTGSAGMGGFERSQQGDGRQSSSMPPKALHSSREEPIVIESSPEP